MRSKDFSPYSDWVQKVCADKNIHINGELTHIKDDKLFCIATEIGDLYLKKTTSFINDELAFTLKLIDLGIITLPELIGYDYDMKILLMRDMGGSDLSLLPSLDMETALNMFITLSRIQKASVKFVKSDDFCGFDYRINTMLSELTDLPESTYKMLSDTQYKITRDETDKLKRNTEYVKSVLEFVKKSYLTRYAPSR